MTMMQPQQPQSKALVPYSTLATGTRVPPEDVTVAREWLRAKRSLHTRKAYIRDIETFYTFVEGVSLRMVTLTMLQDYAEHLTFLRLGSATQARMLATVKSLFTFAHTTGALPFNVGRALQLPLAENRLAERILSYPQVQRMLYTAEKQGNRRNYLILLLLYGSGIRCAELTGLQWRHVQATPQGGQITVTGKRQKTRAIALHPHVWDALQAFRPEGASPGEYVFQSRQATKRAGENGGVPSRKLAESRVWSIVKGVAKEAGIEASTHYFRHAHATHAMERGVPLKVIQETCGWVDLRTPARYQHARPENSSSLYLDL